MNNTDNRVVYVCCPNCGAINQKSVMLISSMRCEKCHTQFSGVVDDGFVTTFVQDQRNKSVPMEERLQRYQQRLSMAVH